jgi:hypothetical protein
MNRNEFENWMKDKVQEQQFSPGEDMWQKLHSDLQKPAGHEKKALLLPFMKLSSVKIAASVILILSLGVAGTYFFNNNNTKNTPDVAVQKTAGSKQPNTSVDSNPSNIADTKNTANTGAPILTASGTTLHKTNITPQHNTGDTPLQSKTPFLLKEEKIEQPQIAQTQNKEEQPPTPQSKTNKEQFPKINNYQQPQSQNPDHRHYARNNNSKSTQAVNLGMAANIGRSTVSDVAYQVGVVGRGNISKRIFVETGISLASNTVNTSSTHAFSGVQLGSDGLTNFETKTMNRVQADYARNVISLGVTPSVGFKVTRRLSVSAGGAVYRNLNPSLELTNGNDIEAAALSKDIISTSQKVTDWDLGVTCNADYKVTRNLSFNLNYRKGLTDYLQTEQKIIKNSGVQLGVKFLFGK